MKIGRCYDPNVVNWEIQNMSINKYPTNVGWPGTGNRQLMETKKNQNGLVVNTQQMTKSISINAYSNIYIPGNK